MASEQMDPYKVLNLPHSADAGQIKRAYHALARKYHPDTWSEACFSETERQQAAAKFVEINSAYTLLSDVQRKADYDRMYRCGAYDTSTNDEHENNSKSQTNRAQQNNTKNTASPPPPPRSDLPPGWTTALDASSGRTYYYHTVSGQTSWQHPSLHRMLPPQPPKSHPYATGTKKHNPSDYQFYHDEQQQSRRPENHQCEAFCALLLCPPIGLIAMYHSIQTDRCWNNNKGYSQAYSHSRSAGNYSTLANCLGIAFWIVRLFFWEDGEFDWPSMDMDGWGGDR